MSGLLAIAADLAVRAGRIALEGRRSDGIIAGTKSSPTDLVTQYDRECERIIVEELTRLRPGDALIGEEGTDNTGMTGIEWHIDPIDGTTNFFFDLPTWAVSIGVKDADGPLAGAVYLPVLGELFTASRGAGARMNGRPIAPRDVSAVSDALLATGFGYDPAARAAHGTTVSRMVGKVRDMRRLGAASVDMCFVACGRLDAYVEGGLNSWDLMAAHVILLESGCTVTGFDGGDAVPEGVIAAPPSIHADVVRLFNEARSAS